MGSYSSSPFTDMCWSAFLLHKLAFDCRLERLHLAALCVTPGSHHKSCKCIVQMTLIIYFTKAKTCRTLFILARTSGTPSTSKRQLFFFSQCRGKVGPNIKWFVPTLLVIFFSFCFGRDMQITKGTVSHLSWERWDQPICFMWKHCYFFLLFSFLMQRQIKAHRLSCRHCIHK